MIVYDTTKNTTFVSLEKWYNKLMESADENIVIMIVGNKVDLTDHRAVAQESAEEFAKAKSLLFIETSALDATNVESAFMTEV